MDTSTIMKSVMNEDTLKMISKASGIDEKQISGVVSSVLPELLNGAVKQNSNADTASAFMQAVMAHGDKNSDDMAGFIKNIDLEDGAKIVGHLLGKDGEKKAEAAAKAAKAAGIDAKSIEKAMDTLAPIVMNQLGKNAKQSSKKNEDAIGDLLGSLTKNVDVDDVMKLAKSFLK